MCQKMENLTDTEKAAIYYYIATSCKDRILIYKLARGNDKFNKLSNSSKAATVSRWFNRPEVVERIKIETYNQEKTRREEAEKFKFVGETETTKPGTPAPVDFLNRDEFLKYLNERANEITDEKDKRDYLKMLSDNMRFKEADNQEQTEIQRFYTPILCENCQIYKKCSSCSGSGCCK